MESGSALFIMLKFTQSISHSLIFFHSLFSLFLMMKSTEENRTIMHEIGHFILYTLFLSSRRGFGKDVFIDNFFEISIIQSSDSYGHVTFSKSPKQLCVNKLCGGFTLLSGTLFSLKLIDHRCEKIRKFDSIREIRENFIYIYCDFGGGEDLLLLLKNSGFGISKTTAYIHELIKIINEIWNSETIRKISRSLYKGLQKNKSLSGETCYSIIKPYIPELKKLGKQIYSIKTKLRISAKAILF